MTAEIAVMNRSAVVLAADSAVTIGKGADAKIYNTVSKIFELSDTCPIGIMISNKMDFMQLPFEVLIKEYRRLRSGQSFDTVQLWKEDFLKYLTGEVKCSDDDKTANMCIIMREAISGINAQFQIAVDRSISSTGKFLKSKLNGILQRILNAEIKRLKSLKFAPGYRHIKFPENYTDIVNNIAKENIRFIELNQSSLKKIQNYMGYYLSKSELSTLKTGLVIAGFGEKDMCPTLIHFETDGIIKDKLKVIEKNEVDIGRDGPTAELLGFAQDDMVQSFVNGCDPILRKYMNTVVREAIIKSARNILSPILTDPDKLIITMDSLSDIFDKQTNDYIQKIDDFVEKNFTQDVKGMLRSMPNPDLATLAESLIEITSLKRKVTKNRETVGGEVDVAVISKAEGLVWVKRKHYFPSELNSAYFARRYKG